MIYGLDEYQLAALVMLAIVGASIPGIVVGIFARVLRSFLTR